jgi:hypothetical protein
MLIHVSVTTPDVVAPGLGSFYCASWVGIDGDGSGDVMFCAICVHSDTEAGFYLTNLTTGASTSFTKTAPEGTHLVGNCAEWIVEAPTVNGGQSALARYGDVYFDECIAGTKNDHLLYGGDGDLITMVDSSNHPISVPTRETNELIKIQFI